MSKIQVMAHTSFLGHTGYNSHSKNFFTNLNNYIPTRVRNYSYCKDLSYLKPEEMSLLIEQDWNDPPHKIGFPFVRDPEATLVNIVLNESHHYFFYDNYESPMIAYNVWEATKQIPQYFNRILEYDQFWCPTEWQRQCTIDQGYPEHRVKVVPEGVNGNIFCPTKETNPLEAKKQFFAKYDIPNDTFVFMIFGRWDYRKSTTEMIQAFAEKFKDEDDVILLISVDNPFASDELKTTEDRLAHYKIPTDKIKVVHFPPREDYIKFLQHGNCLLSCSRSEGWNLPLMEAIACGTPTIASNWGGHLEFADGISHLVDVPKELAIPEVFLLGDKFDYGVYGEPDFDHLKYVMWDVYKNYTESKENAVKRSKFVRDLYTWDNAARKAEGYINELCQKKSIKSEIKKVENYFETSFESVDGSPRVNFKPSINYNGKLLVTIKNADSEEHHESWFTDLKSNVNYWISLGSFAKKILFEIFDVNFNLVYTETKEINIKQNSSCEMELYQDQIVNGEIVVEGKRECSSRYEAMKKVFEKYKRPFTILDIGANFGYYSIRAASEYDATSIMIESEDNEVKTLINLCEKNDCGENLSVLQTRLDLYKLKEICKCEHFDVVLALNVIHHFNTSETLEVCEALTKLGDNVILETPPVEDHGACGQNNLKTIVDYFNDVDKIKLGEFKRHTSNTVSELFWIQTDSKTLEWPYYEYEELFTRKDVDVEKLKNRDVDGAKSVVESDFISKKIRNPRREEVLDWIPGINLLTFLKLNGVYPNLYDITKKLKTRDISGDYKWDNTNKDIMLHNFILNGTTLYMIDYDDDIMGSGVVGDKAQLEFVSNQIRDSYVLEKPEEEKIKINLGCGNDIKHGYINIDRYNNTTNVDIISDIGTLPFKDGSVDEIFNSHVFEHIPVDKIYGVIEEWRRVLTDDGHLEMFVPDLEADVKAWLNADDDKKWLQVPRIFGSQTNTGFDHVCGFNLGSLKSFIENFNFEVLEIRNQTSRGMDEIYMRAIKKPDIEKTKADYVCHFVGGPFLEIKGQNTNDFFMSDFLDPDNNSSVHQQLVKINNWIRPHRKYFTDWHIQVHRNGILDFDHKFNAKGKRILISFDTKSLGDTIAWIPYMQEFKKKHGCELYVSTFWNRLFQPQNQYSDIHWVVPGKVVNNLYASYSVGCYDNDRYKNKTNWRAVPLQQVCSDVLGLEYKEIVPKMQIEDNREREIKEKYVCLSEFSTFQCKLWNHPGAWQQIVDYLNELGYKVVVISKEKTKLQRIIDRTNSPINDTINTMRYCEFFLGVSAGPSWLAWSLDVPVVLISGYSARWGEFKTKIKRVINEDVCHGCFNDPTHPLERGNWNWCPRQKGTPRQFECTKLINPDMVKKSINEIITGNYDRID